MKLYLARHGQSNYNRLGLCNGDPAVDVHLTEVGLQQAAVLAARLKSASFDEIIVSQMKRTQQTAEIINRYHEALIRVDARLNDNRSGYEGQPVFDYYAALDLAENRWTARFNAGESLEDVKRRAGQFFEELTSLNLAGVLVVTSEVIVHAIYAVANDLPNDDSWQLQVDNGSCLELEV